MYVHPRRTMNYLYRLEFKSDKNVISYVLASSIDLIS